MKIENLPLNAIDSSRGWVKTRTEFKKYLKHKGLVLLFLPGIIYYLVFQYAPMYGIIIAFKDYRFALGIIGSPWLGFDNFVRLFNSPTFIQVFTNTLIISGLKLLFGFPAPIILALLLNEVRNITYKKVIQTVTYLPHFVSWVVLSGLFMQLLSPSTGLINQLIANLGFKPIYFMADVKWFRPMLVVTSIWKEIGWGSIIYIASLAGINPEFYEAARIDGASKLKQVIYITIPSLAPAITVMFILAVGKLISDDFDQIFNLYNPAVYRVGDVISTYTYRVGLVDMDYGYATAVGLFKNVIALVLIVTANSISKKINDYGIY